MSSKKYTITHPNLLNNICAILKKNKVLGSDAFITADVLVEGELRGYPTHGINRIFQILEGFNQNTLTTTNNSFNLTKKNLNQNSQIIDGKKYLGQPLALSAIKQAIKLAKQHSIGLSGVINSGHIGILSYYTEIAAREQCLAIALTTSSPAVVLPGGNKKLLGTNPIAYSFPTNANIITADFSSSIVSRGKIIEYKEQNLAIPAGWGVDAHGNPTSDPQAVLEGGLNAFGGIKGTLLSLLFSMLAGPLIGGVANHLVTGTRSMAAPPTKGDLFIVIDIAQLTELSHFYKQVELFFEYAQTNKSTFYVPGSRSYRQRADMLKSGIPLNEKIIELFNQYNLEIT